MPLAPPRPLSLLPSLASLTASAPLAIDMYVPAFPDMVRTLETTGSGVQLSMTAFLAGLVLGQFLLGPVSDTLGRRRLLLGGTALFGLFSLLCAVAPTVQFLVGARFLQGAAGACGAVLARAVIVDWYRGPGVARYFSTLAIITGVAPVAAPLIGALVLLAAPWQAIFVVLALVGLAQFAAVWWRVPESLPPDRRNPGGLRDSFRAMGGLLRNRFFVGYAIALSCAAGGLFTYVSGSSFVFQIVYGMSPLGYGVVFAVNAISMTVAAGLFGALSRRVRLNTLLMTALSVSFLATLVHVAIDLTTGGNVAATWICLVLAISGLGMTFPAIMTIGQSVAGHSAGSASALLGGGQFLLGAVAAPIVGVFGVDSATPMAVIMLVAFTCAVLALAVLARPWRGHGEHRVTAS
ncbi:Bcr/CflA family drug resistance efflux transporter [Acrocarpospora phusangensis]|uniref:Bcr/CflA family drug resistance efflux transporter n=1 Tax=Acrocarpospora phusangensis TaxID=1070424 RepID=A0A919Q7L8_9ACTN|nr:multidrug effflux MFS transporter [Acrocarpospora phusangensis]GIH23681.1 Bcr/CflA family drug resistance efflux transporter [Acrocarpospora phusangensis]